MSYPILYSATETSFDHNGIGILSACVSCEVTEEANGIFELAMQYPMDGVHFAEIGDRAIIKAKADQFRDPQLFRVYAISKPMNGIVTVLAEHISYDLSGIPVKTFSASSASSALAGLKNNAVVDCPFNFWTDKSTSANFKVSVPASIRSRLGGVAGSILDVYGGEYEFDNYTVKLHNNRGMNRGVSIRYGKNLTDIKQEQNCASVATGVYPYWAGTVDEKDVLVELPERIVNAPGTYNFVKIRTLDLSSEFETQPTVERLRSKTESYIKNNNIGVPSVSLTVSFAQLEQTEEYKHLKLLERVSLFDTVNVEFPALGVSATAKAVKMVYDVIADRVKSVTLGSVRANIADTIATQQKEIDYSKDKPTLSMVQKISSALAKAIMGADGGAVRLIDTNDDGEPDELYIADNADPTKALKVWRFNYNGWAASKNGYSGPFEFGATLEEGLLANFVTAAHLVAGTIKSADSGETFFLDLDNGILNMNATSLNISGKTVDTIAQEKANAAEGNAKTYADTAASNAVSAQTQTDIFNKLTNNGQSQGLFILDGELYINASYLVTGILRSKDGTTFYLDLDKGVLRGKFEELSISGKTVDDIAQEKADAAEDNAVGQASDLADAAAKNAEKNAREELNNYAATVSKEIEGLQSQIDKNITTWFGDYVPQRINSPAIGWIGLGKEEQHQGDLFYVVDNEKHGGKVYRWVPIDDIYEWRLIEDTELAKALADAAKAQDTADGKRRVFVDEPVPPYDVGDLWAQGSGGDLMRCVTARESGSYDAADWDLASKYIDEESAESIAQNKVDSQTQEDIFNKLTNNGQDQGIYIQDGLVYINATYIKSGKIVSEGMAYLPPTYDDCIDMLMSLSFPDRYPPKDFYDINGDGVFDVEDVRLANMVYLGKIKMADCAGAVATAVTVTIDPFNAEETVVLSGINAWGKQISMSLGVTRSKIPHIDGDCAVSGRLSVGGHLVTPSLAFAIGETPKTLSWKDNGDGTFTPIGQ